MAAPISRQAAREAAPGIADAAGAPPSRWIT